MLSPLLRVLLALCAVLLVVQGASSRAQGEHIGRILFAAQAESDGTGVRERLDTIYNEFIQPAEKAYHYDATKSSILSRGGVARKPVILLTGTSGSGKSTAVQHLLGTMGGNKRYTPTGSSGWHFTILSHDGSHIDVGQKHVREEQLDNDLLKQFTVVDTHVDGADTTEEYWATLRWLLTQTDLALFVFDAHNENDVGKQLGKLIAQHQPEKYRILLNKADSVSEEELLTSYGDLMWRLSEPLGSSAPKPQVYVVSLTDNGRENHESRETLLYNDEVRLAESLSSLSAGRTNSAIDEMLEHARRVRLHATLVTNYVNEYRARCRLERTESDQILDTMKEEAVDAELRELLSEQDYRALFEDAELVQSVNADKHGCRTDDCVLDRLDEAINEHLPALIDGRATDLPPPPPAATKKSFRETTPPPHSQVHEHVREEVRVSEETTVISPTAEEDNSSEDDSAENSSTENNVLENNSVEISGAGDDSSENHQSGKNTSAEDRQEDETTAEEADPIDEIDEPVIVEPEAKHINKAHLSVPKQASDQPSTSPFALEAIELMVNEALAWLHSLGNDREKPVADRCKYRKSCYLSGELPSIEQVDIQTAFNPSAILAKFERAEQKAQTIEEKCKYRKSCYVTGEVPVIQSRETPTTTISFNMADYLSLFKFEMPKETRELTVQESCKYRKSCYESGVVPNIETTVVSAPTSGDLAYMFDFSSWQDKDERPKSVEEMCKWRKSCYTSGVLPAISAESVSHFSDVFNVDVVDELSAYMRTGETREKTIEEKCKWRKSCYATGELPVIKPLSFDDMGGLPNLGIPTAEPRAQTVESRCRYRKSCYETGIPPTFEQAEVTHVPHRRSANVAAAVNFEQRESSSKNNDKTDEEPDAAAIKRNCLYRKSCYESGEIPDIVSNIFGGGHESEPSLPETISEEQRAALHKVHCRYRKSCYESGVVPDARQDIFGGGDESPVVTSVDVDDDGIDIKSMCKYRKSCYTTGELPDIDHNQHTHQHQAETTKSAPTLRDIQAMCKYRKACLEQNASADSRAETQDNDKIHDITDSENKAETTINEAEPTEFDEVDDTSDSEDDEIISEDHVEDESRTNTESQPDEDDVEKPNVQVESLAGEGDSSAKEEPESDNVVNEPASNENNDDEAVSEEAVETVKDQAATPKTETSDDSPPSHELNPKRQCLYRKSCYENGERPTIKQDIFGGGQHTAATSGSHKHDSDDDGSVSITSQCRYRLSCYESGQLPDDFGQWSDVVENSAPKSSGNEEDSDDVLAPKRRCHYRQSCYDSGIVPEMSDNIWQAAVQSPTDGESIQHDQSEANKKVACKYRLSCYESSDVSKSEHHEAPVSSEKKQKVESHDQDKVTVKASKQRNKGKSNAGDIYKEHEDKAKETPITTHDSESGSDIEPEDHTIDRIACKYRKSCYATGEVPALDGNIWGTVVERSAEQIVKTDDPADGKRQCHYRHSCYETGVVPPLGGNTWAAPVETSDTVVDDDHEQSAADEKRSCKYRRSCYDTGVLPELSSNVWTAPVKTAHDNEESIEHDQSVADSKRACKYRVSCYETGVVPPVEDTVRSAPVEKVNKADSNADEEQSAADAKRMCKYRQSCYESGIVPEVDGGVWGSQVAGVTRDAHDLGHEHTVANEKRVCKYRRSCYDPEIVRPLTEEELENRAQLAKQVEPVPTGPTLINTTCSLYRISCRLANKLPPKDAKGRSVIMINGERMCRRTGPSLIAARQEAKKETRQ